MKNFKKKFGNYFTKNYLQNENEEQQQSNFEEMKMKVESLEEMFHKIITSVDKIGKDIKQIKKSQHNKD